MLRDCVYIIFVGVISAVILRKIFNFLTKFENTLSSKLHVMQHIGGDF